MNIYMYSQYFQPFFFFFVYMITLKFSRKDYFLSFSGKYTILSSQQNYLLFIFGGCQKSGRTAALSKHTFTAFQKSTKESLCLIPVTIRASLQGKGLRIMFQISMGSWHYPSPWQVSLTRTHFLLTDLHQRFLNRSVCSKSALSHFGQL